MLEFDSLAAAFNRQTPLTIYCAVRNPSSDFEAATYPEWLIEHYGRPFEESIVVCDDGIVEQQAFLFSDCQTTEARETVLNPWRGFAAKAGQRLIDRGLSIDRAPHHTQEIEWVLKCIKFLPRPNPACVDQEKFDQSKGLVWTLDNAWGWSSFVCLELAKSNTQKNTSVETPSEPVGTKTLKRPNANIRMLEYMQKHPEAKDFTVRQWMDAIGVNSPSTIHSTKAWGNLQSVKGQSFHERLERQSNKMNKNPNSKKNPKKNIIQ